MTHLTVPRACDGEGVVLRNNLGECQGVHITRVRVAEAVCSIPISLYAQNLRVSIRLMPCPRNGFCVMEYARKEIRRRHVGLLSVARRPDRLFAKLSNQLFYRRLDYFVTHEILLLPGVRFLRFLELSTARAMPISINQKKQRFKPSDSEQAAQT